MEKITRLGGKIYYGDKVCKHVDAAYSLFREDYHRSLGKAVYRMLNRQPRQERIHGHDSNLRNEEYETLNGRYAKTSRVKCRIMGIVDISYVYMVGIWDCPDVDESEFDEYMDWLFDRRTRNLRIVGRGNQAGRTSDRNKVRFK